jgi:hypothetical protein
VIRLLWPLLVLAAASVVGAAVAADFLIHAPSSLILRTLRRWSDGQRDLRVGLATYEPQPEDEAATEAMTAWATAGDPLQDAPAAEMGVWVTPEQADELDCLAADTWPRNEYFAIADLYVRGESS